MAAARGIPSFPLSLGDSVQPSAEDSSGKFMDDFPQGGDIIETSIPDAKDSPLSLEECSKTAVGTCRKSKELGKRKKIGWHGKGQGVAPQGAFKLSWAESAENMRTE